MSLIVGTVVVCAVVAVCPDPVEQAASDANATIIKRLIARGAKIRVGFSRAILANDQFFQISIAFFEYGKGNS
jgi:hypothetical protein